MSMLDPVSYLRGYAEGADLLTGETKESRFRLILLETLEGFAVEMDEIHALIDDLDASIDDIDADLSAVEDAVFDEVYDLVDLDDEESFDYPEEEIILDDEEA